MPANAKTVKRRIKSIASTRKITKAMELVAASKMRKATQSVLATRPFAKLSWETIGAISKATGELTHPLLEENKKAEKTLFVLFTADRGLAGGLNTNMMKRALSEIQTQEGTVEAIAVGKRGTSALARKNTNIIAQFEGLSNKPTFEDTLPIGNLVIETYLKGEYKKVLVGYTDYISGLVQRPKVFELLPLGKPIEELGEISGDEEVGSPAEPGPASPDGNSEVGNQKTEYLFEPDPQKVLDRILPRLIETMLYQALLESAASEHSARMMAMRSATDSASEMLDELKLTYNRIRQAGITQEIAEISSGKAAIE